jgi:hypothetical protein
MNNTKMPSLMVKIKNVVLVFIVLSIFLVSECNAMNVFYWDISFSKQRTAQYRILPNGIAKITRKDFIIFVKPANKIHVGDKEQVFLFSFNKRDLRNQSLFSDAYYPDGSSLMSKPDYFYVEVLLYSKKDGYVLNPKKIEIVNSKGERISVERYLVVDERLEGPCNYGDGNLLKPIPFNDECFSIKKERDKSILIDLPARKLIGFAVKFNVPPPTPGDLFTIDIKGFEYKGNPVEVPSINYDAKKTYIWGAN